MKTIKGQSVFELVMAIAIILISVGAGVIVFFSGQSLTTDTEQSNSATYLARELLENARFQARQNFGNLVSVSSTYGQYSEETSVSVAGQYEKQVTVTVSWPGQFTGTRSVSYSTIVTDWRGYTALGGDTLGTPPVGNWSNPKTFGSINLGPNEQATGIEVRNGIVYLTTATNKKPDFFIVDATNAQNPFIIASSTLGGSLNGVEVAGDYAYVVGPTNGAQLQIVNISNVNSPTFVSSLGLQGGAAGLSVYFYNNYAFVGRDATAQQQFVVVDVSNPSSPVVVGGLNVGGAVSDVFVYCNRAYLATTNGLAIIDVSNPSQPVLLATKSVGGAVYSVFPQTNSLVTVGSANNFYVMDATIATSTKILGSINIGGEVSAIVSIGPYAFLGTYLTNSEFYALDISSSSNPRIISSFNFPNFATGIDYENNLVYVSVRSNDGLRIITSQ